MSKEPPAIVADSSRSIWISSAAIHVGNLEEHQRITRILKLALEARYQQSFVTERWGRGVFWQWIGFLVRAQSRCMPLSSAVSFGCLEVLSDGRPRLSHFPMRSANRGADTSRHRAS